MTRRNPGVVLRGDRNECPTCNLLFHSNGAFERHRIGAFGVDRRCATVAEMIALGMSQRPDGFWVASKMPDADRVSLESGRDRPAALPDSHPDTNGAP